jgi:hypothetical protein
MSLDDMTIKASTLALIANCNAAAKSGSFLTSKD